MAASALISSLRAAQHALDTADGREYSSVVSHGTEALTHLEHVYRSRKTYAARGRVVDSSIEWAADQFALSLEEFSDRALGHSLRLISELATLSAHVRGELGLPSRPSAQQRTMAAGDGADYASKALGDALDMITHQAGAAYTILVMQGDRNLGVSGAGDVRDPITALISGSTGRIAEQCDYAKHLVGRLQSTTSLSAFARQADRAATAILNVSSWLRQRTGTGLAIQMFTSVIASIDGVLGAIGAPSVESRPEPRHSAIETNEAEKEEADLTAKRELLCSAADNLKDRKLAAIQSFEQLVAMQDDNQPSFVAEIAKALLITTLGNVGGHFVSRFLKHVVNDRAADTIGGIASDSIQAVSGKAADGAMESTRNASALTKARVFFTEGLKLDAADATRQYKDMLTNAIHAKTVMAKDFPLTQQDLDQSLAPIVDTYRQEIMLMWPRYVAQAALGATGSKGHEVTKMDDYFGEKPRPENKFAGSLDRSGTSGVMSVRFTIIDGDPFSQVEPIVQDDGSEINGMNSNVKADVFKLAGGQLDRVQLPKEIFVRLKGGSMIGWARLAVDESGLIRDSADWERLLVAGGVKKFYSDPQSLWQHIRGRQLAS
ncbi:MAG: hypothetical protein AB7L94_15470 [Kofleriaceae bacterium]